MKKIVQVSSKTVSSELSRRFNFERLGEEWQAGLNLVDKRFSTAYGIACSYMRKLAPILLCLYHLKL